MELLDVLTELGRSGRLGPVANGADWDEVTAALGEPFDMAVGEPGSWPRLLAYGDLELSVCACRTVVLICLQTWPDVVELPPGLLGPVDPVDGGQAFAGHPTYEEVTAALDRAGCAWEHYAPLTFGDQRAVRALASGVVFVFEIPEGEAPLLNVVGPQPHRHDCPAPSGSGAATRRV